MKKITTLEEAFIHGLSDTYSAEQQMAKALPKLAKEATNPLLIQGFQDHLVETKTQIDRIDQIVDMLGIKIDESVKCKAMEGLIKESDETIAEIKKGPIRDVMLIAGAQKVEHYEIASYGCLVEIAKGLGYSEAAALLEETLEEEKSTDEKLTHIAVSSVNEEAMELSNAA